MLVVSSFYFNFGSETKRVRSFSALIIFLVGNRRPVRTLYSVLRINASLFRPCYLAARSLYFRAEQRNDIFEFKNVHLNVIFFGNMYLDMS